MHTELNDATMQLDTKYTKRKFEVFSSKFKQWLSTHASSMAIEQIFLHDRVTADISFTTICNTI